MNQNGDRILQGVLNEFFRLCAIPHPSGGEERIARVLFRRLVAMGLQPELDAHYNLICDVPGTAGMEDRPMLALQAHMDMVAVGTEAYCPETDPIHTVIRDGWLCSDGKSSLGADCGIGLAAVLFLITEKWAHGPLRLILTADEERGLQGAKHIRRDVLSGCHGLVNLDGFHFGSVLISSAGGLRQTFTKEPMCFFPMLEQAVQLTISGLIGGHSGDDIGRGRANAGQMMIWLLQSLTFPYELGRVQVGNSHNAIPNTGEAVIVIDSRDMDKLTEAVEAFQQEIAQMFRESDPNIKITVGKTELPAWVLTLDERDDLLALGGLIPCGVQEMHPICPTVPGLSCNLGMLYGDESRLEIRAFPRACREDALDTIGAFQKMAAEGFGYEVQEDRYPAWPGGSEDRLSGMMLELGEELGIPMKKTASHVGLETSVFHSLAPEIPMVSTGMEILDAHSVSERVRLDTIPAFTELLGMLLEKW